MDIRECIYCMSLFLQQNDNIRFFPRQMTISSMILGNFLEVSLMGSIAWMAFKSNKKQVGYFDRICVIIESVYLTSQYAVYHRVLSYAMLVFFSLLQYSIFQHREYKSLELLVRQHLGFSLFDEFNKHSLQQQDFGEQRI